MNENVTAPDDEDDELEGLQSQLRRLGRVVVAFSGGTDSALLTYAAHAALGRDAVLAVTAVSPSLASGERDHCEALAAQWGVRWRAVDTNELENATYVRNEGDRCYWCKAELMDVIGPIAQAEHAVAVLGVNLDDLGEHRPGQAAARERGARFPLVDAGLTKDRVRALSRRLGLPTWDRPAAACLASRLPYGTPVTLEALTQIDRAEAGLRALGLSQLRVRHYDDTARLEVDLTELDTVIARRTEVVEVVRAAGYRYVTLDLEGFRSGNLNAALFDPHPGAAVPIRLSTGRRSYG